MKHLLKHKGYSAWVQPVGSDLFAMIQEPKRKLYICEVPAVAASEGERPLRAKAKAAIERDILTRR